MKVSKVLYFSENYPPEIELSSTTVWLRSNIVQIDDVTWECDEEVMSRDDYTKMIANKQNIESQFTTEIDLDVQQLKQTQKIESSMTTQLDLEILTLMDELSSIKEVLKKNGIK